jgi:hypothetical protein
MPRKPATKFPNLRKKLQKVKNQTGQAKKKVRQSCLWLEHVHAPYQRRIAAVSHS